MFICLLRNVPIGFNYYLKIKININLESLRYWSQWFFLIVFVLNFFSLKSKTYYCPRKRVGLCLILENPIKKNFRWKKHFKKKIRKKFWKRNSENKSFQWNKKKYSAKQNQRSFHIKKRFLIPSQMCTKEISNEKVKLYTKISQKINLTKKSKTKVRRIQNHGTNDWKESIHYGRWR